ncbi:IS110 family RNA-guided transposase [Pontibacter pamirensis]|uniref:IS110 family transposase n=1 Tax=Pontibacter pamirensis TaxID=2562824 RepID=UPI001389A5C3|nr:IS110 family transposase [Pontibacter pamirensis]
MEYAEKQVACVGIDISKDFFDAALPVAGGKHRHLQLGNEEAGFERLFQEIKEPAACRVVMEASGPYYLRLAGFLHAKGVMVSVVNPLVIRRFCQMRLTRAKTDKKDAVMIARYGQAEQPAPWEPEAAHVVELKQLQTVAEGLQKTLHQHERQLEALQQAPHVSRQARQSLERMVRQAEKEKQQVEERMELLIREHHQQLYEQVSSIPGLGKKSTLLLILVTGGFTRFAHYKQLVSYLGLSPRIYESGSSVRGRSRICKMGMSRARAVLYVCSWSAIRCNKACKELYERLVTKGKAKRLALIAVANKLIKQAFAIATKGEYYMEKS